MLALGTSWRHQEGPLGVVQAARESASDLWKCPGTERTLLGRMASLRWILAILLLGISLHLTTGQDRTNKGPELYRASQCFKSRGIPKVAFQCPPNHMIKIHRAFHGISERERSPEEMEEQCPAGSEPTMANCTQCQGDCIDDSMNLVYDWSTCMGNTSCIRTVMQSYMPACPGRDKFSDYLQVEYQCIPRPDVIDICSKVERTIKEGYLFSPNYPRNYPVGQDCLCKLYTDWTSRIQLSLYDLLLETRNGRCRADWLMLRQKEQKHRHCGAIMTGTKNITSDTNSVEIQFHSDENDNRTQNFQYFTRSLKGFWLYFNARPSGNIKISCRRLTPEDAEVREIMTDDEEFEEVVGSTREGMTTMAPEVTKDMESGEEMPVEEPEEPTMKPNGNGPMKRPRPGRPDGNQLPREGGIGANYQEGLSSGTTRTMNILPGLAAMLLAIWAAH